MSRRFIGDVSEICRRCLGDVSEMSRKFLEDSEIYRSKSQEAKSLGILLDFFRALPSELSFFVADLLLSWGLSVS